jgi:hypothetical protein
VAVLTITNPTVLFALWGKPTKWDADRVTEQLTRLYAEAGRQIIYIARIPDSAPAPDADVRKYMDGLMPKFVECCSTYHVILEGKGFVAALKRGVLVSLFQIGWRRGTFFVHASSNEVVHKLPKAQHAEVADVLERARIAGFLSADAPSTIPPPGKPRQAAPSVSSATRP